MITKQEIDEARYNYHQHYDVSYKIPLDALMEDIISCCEWKGMCKYHLDIYNRLIKPSKDALLAEEEQLNNMIDAYNLDIDLDETTTYTKSNVCPACEGKGYVMDHNPLGINDSSIRSKNATRGWLDMFVNGGGNRKDCSRCNGTGYR